MRATTSDHEPSSELVLRVGGILAEGGLVALPTETVYGIAARADRLASLEALAELKGRPLERAFTWHVGEASALERFPRASAMARRLAERYWPGPLTLVLPGVVPGLELVARDGWTGVRCVAHRSTAGILAALDFPVVMTSANVHGQPAPAEAGDIERSALGAQLALIVDGGAARLREPSSVLRLGRGRFELLREGLHDLAQLRAAAGLRIGFACTGNTCRSPMAEGLARPLLARRLEIPPQRLAEHGFELRSMGVMAGGGAEASPHAVQAMKERQIDISGHRSSPAVMESLPELDVLYCLTEAHLEALRMLLPPGKAGHLRLLDPEGGDIQDPVGGDLSDYRRCAERILECIEAHLDEWA